MVPEDLPQGRQADGVAVVVTKAFTERNTRICEMYVGGATMQACADQFKISKERVRQLLRRAGVYKSDRLMKASSARQSFIGVNVSESTKLALKEKAAGAGTSVSRLASDVLDGLVKP